MKSNGEIGDHPSDEFDVLSFGSMSYTPDDVSNLQIVGRTSRKPLATEIGVNGTLPNLCAAYGVGGMALDFDGDIDAEGNLWIYGAMVKPHNEI
jgi:hypothetical protein